MTELQPPDKISGRRDDQTLATISSAHEPDRRREFEKSLSAKLREVKAWWFVLRLFVVAFTLFVVYWIVIQNVVPSEVRPLSVGVDIVVVLSPVFVASVLVERFLEALFNVFEANWRTLVAYLGRGLRWLQNAEEEVESARQFLSKVSAEYNYQLFKSLSSADTEAERPATGRNPATTQSNLEAGLQEASLVRSAKTYTQEYLVGLWTNIIEKFDDNELRSLCFVAGADYGDLPGEGRQAKATELVRYCERRHRIPELVAACYRERPDVAWGDASVSNPGELPRSEPLLSAPSGLVTAKALVDLAERRLESAEARLSQVTKVRSYKSFKLFATTYLGLLAGLIIATATSLQLFALMGARIGDPRIDVIIGGLAIGAGSGLIHSVFKFLTDITGRFAG